MVVVVVVGVVVGVVVEVKEEEEENQKSKEGDEKKEIGVISQAGLHRNPGALLPFGDV